MNGKNDAFHGDDSRRAASYRTPWCLVLLASLCATAAAAGQPVSGADLAVCSSQETDERKLACFEALAERRGEAPEDAGKRATASPPPDDDDKRRPPEPRQQAGGADAVLPEIDNAAGREHLDDEKTSSEPEPEVVTATITRVTRGRNRHYYFHLDNGQIWRQMESGYVHYPKDRAFDVHISRGLMGDYQMRVGGDGRMTRIVRVQ